MTRNLSRPRLEALESRQLLTASPELLIDANTEFENPDLDVIFWQSGDRGVFVQEPNLEWPAHPKDSEVEIYASDGTTVGTSLAATLNGSIDEHTVFRDALVFKVSHEGGADQVWITDGTEAGTTSLISFSGRAPRVDGFLESGDKLFIFTSDVFDPGVQVWITDGTAEGTQALLSDDGDAFYKPELFRSTNNGKAFFFIDTNIWVTDGTAEGTHVVETDRRPQTSTRVVMDSHLVFDGPLESNQTKLYITDGESTQKLVDGAGADLLATTSSVFGSTSDQFFGSTDSSTKIPILVRGSFLRNPRFGISR